jgi:hypothetical protein
MIVAAAVARIWCKKKVLAYLWPRNKCKKVWATFANECQSQVLECCLSQVELGCKPTKVSVKFSNVVSTEGVNTIEKERFDMFED